MGPLPLNLGNRKTAARKAAAAEVPAQVVAYLENSYEPFNTLLKCALS